MEHLEDLPIDKFIECVSNLDKFSVSEKIDGSELIFGLDETGKFYTSREAKSGKRYYSESDWPKQFWTTGFRGAHLALEHIESVLKLLLVPGDSIEIEVLFGPTPNTVPYNADGINRIVFLRPISRELNLKQLKDKIDAFTLRGIKVDLNNVPSTTNGFDFTTNNSDEQEWKFETAPNISLNNFPKKEINETLNQLNDFLNTKSLLEKTNLDLAKTRITKSNKEVIENTRFKIQEFKNKIKENLMKSLLNRSSVFGPALEAGGWIEGLVFRNPETNFQFKLVDKEKFTFYNKKNHHLQNYIRENYWKKFKKDLYEILAITSEDKRKERIYFEDYSDISSKNFGFDVEYIAKRIRKKSFDYLNSLTTEYQILPTKKEHINKQNCQKIFEEFAGTKKRIMDLTSKTFEATQIEHLVELVLTEDIVADQKKHFHKDTRRIYKKEIPETLKYLGKVLDIDYKYLKEQLLGSTGKSESNGDIDICLNADLAPHIRYRAKQFLPTENIFESKGLGIIHLIVPIKGNNKNGFVQVDIMLSENTSWTKFYFDSVPGKSKYKGLYRNALLRALTASTNTTLWNPGGELVERQGYVLVPNKGLESQLRRRLESKNGGLVKSFKVLERGKILNNPDDVVKFLFPGKEITLESISTFEGLLEAINKNRPPEQQELIYEITKKILKDLKYKLPKELVHGV